MDYQKVYDAIIAKWVGQAPDGYSEIHHIIPKCIGGLDAPDNLVRLPARVHFVAHLLLARIHGGKLAHAAYRMSNMRRYGNRRYAWLREMNAAALRGNKFGAGHIPSPETRAKLSAARMGNTNAMGNKGKPARNRGMRPSAETIERMRLSHLGKKPSAKSVAALRLRSIGNTFGAANKGMKRGPMSDEHKAKIAQRISEVRATKKWKSR